MKELFELVKNKPDKKLNGLNVKCPYCKSSDLRTTETTETLVGGPPGVNHRWESKVCNDCGKKFTLESKYMNYWITDKDRKVLKGMPCCFERYIYTCKCGGNVTREYRDKNGSPINSLSYIDGKPQFNTFFRCDTCNKEIETEDGYWSPNR